MAYSERARQYAADILRSRRISCAVETDRRRAEALERLPELAELEAAATALGISCAKSMLSGGDAGAGQSLEDQLAELRKKREHLLLQAGLAPDTLDPVHICARCRDTGVTPDGASCACLKSLLNTYSLSEINRVSPLALCEFDSFSLDWYPTEFDKELDGSPRDVMRENFEECRRFAREFPQNNGNLLLTGDAGLGKTHLALSIANEVLRRGYEVLYCSAANIFREIEIEQFNQNRDTTTLDSLKRCDLLILDDLGAEHTGYFMNAVLYDLVNTRLVQNRPTVYTTNITTDRVLNARYGEKVTSRLVGCSKTLPFCGEDIRMLKNTD